MSEQTIFHPVEGAVIDLESLQALGGVEDAVLGALLRTVGAPERGVVLEGIELMDPAKSPPNTLVFSPGKAVLRRPEGALTLARVPQVELNYAQGQELAAVAIELQSPVAARPRAVLSATASLRPCARGLNRAQYGEWLKSRDRVLLAVRIDMNRGWIPDVDRIYGPGHAWVKHWVGNLDRLIDAIWEEKAAESLQAKPINFDRLRTCGSAAVYAARAAMLSGPMSSADRLRLLNALYVQLAAIQSETVTNTLIPLIHKSYVEAHGPSVAPELYKLRVTQGAAP